MNATKTDSDDDLVPFDTSENEVTDEQAAIAKKAPMYIRDCLDVSFGLIGIMLFFHYSYDLQGLRVENDVVKFEACFRALTPLIKSHPDDLEDVRSIYLRHYIFSNAYAAALC